MVVVRVGGVMVAGVEVVVIGVNREGWQRRGEIGRRTDGLEVKKMIGRVRADEDGEIEVREGGVGRGLWSLIFGPVISLQDLIPNMVLAKKSD